MNWVLFLVGEKCEHWVIAPDVISKLVYVRRRLLNKKIFNLWECPEYIWMQMNEDKLNLL